MDKKLYLNRLLNIPTEINDEGHAVFGPEPRPEERLEMSRTVAVFDRPKLTLSIEDWTALGCPTSVVLHIEAGVPENVREPSLSA